MNQNPLTKYGLWDCNKDCRYWPGVWFETGSKQVQQKEGKTILENNKLF